MITGKTFCLRPWHEGDLQSLTELRNNIPLQSQLLSRVRGSNLEQTRKWLQQRFTSPDSLFLIIAAKDNDDTLGYIQYTEIEQTNRYAKLGICIAENHQGKEIGQESLKLSLTYLRNTLAIRKAILEVRADNNRAIRCYEKIGFKKYGTLSEHFFIDGQWFDLILMEIFLSSIS